MGAWRALGLAGKLAVLALVAAILLAVVIWIANWDPFGSKQRLETKAANAELQASTSSLEVQGAEASTQRVEVVVRTREAAQQSLTDVSRHAAEAPDANAPLPPDRASRLRAHDDFLCRLRPLQGCAPAASADAGVGASRLPDVPPT